MSSPSLAVIGAGSLARTLLSGWDAASVQFQSITTVSRRASRAEELSDRNVTAISVDHDPDAAARAVYGANIVIIAVKPWMVAALLPQIAGPIAATRATVISVVSGVRLDTLRQGLGAAPTIVRVLPNTPSQVNRGVAGLVGDGDPSRVEEVRHLFRALGDVVDVDEEGLDALTVLTGSAPAFFYLFTEKLTDAMRQHGFPSAQAERMARGVFVGSARLLQMSRDDPQELRRRVTSPNGVTHQAIEVFESRGLGVTMNEAVAAGLARAKELAAAPPPTA